VKAELTINIRPVRHVYFVDENDLERFVEVASYCSTQWGGINNLIIPVQIDKETGDVQIHIHSYNMFLINLRQPDIFVDALSGKEENSSIRDSLASYLTSLVLDKSLHQWLSFIQFDDSFHPLNILSPQGDSSKQELAMVGYFPDYSAPRSQLDEAIIAAAFGKIWPGQKKDYEEAYTFKAWNTSYPDRFFYQQLLLDPYASVINLTLKDLHNIGTENIFPSLHFDVVVVRKVWDLCRFWNLRAQSFGHTWLADRHVLLLSKEQLLHEQGGYFKSLIRLLREHRTHKNIESNIDVVFHHCHDQEIHDFLLSHSELQQHEGSLQTSIHDVREEDSADEIYRPIIYGEDSIIGVGAYHEFGGTRSTFSQELTTDSETFLVPSAGPRTAGAQKAFVGLQSAFWQQFPNHPSVANLIVPNSSFSKLLDTIQLSYPLILTPRGLERIAFNIPQTWQIYHAYFRSKGYEVSASDKKTYADGLLGMAGGLEQETAQVLRSRVGREILDFLTDKATIKLAREVIRRLGLQDDQENNLLQIISNLGVLPQNQRVPKAFGDIYSHIRGVQGLASIERKVCLQNLAKLVGIKIVQRGMYVKCSHCGTRTWYGIYSLDEQIRCNGCLSAFDLPLVENDNDDVERPFQYSLNPLANQAMDQDILPVIAALLALRTHHATMHHIVMGMNFQKVGGTNRDGDFDFIYTYKQGLYGGECKSGGIFNIKDINTAKLAQSLGFRAYFFVAMRPIEEDGQRLIADYQQELASNINDEHPFAIFVLNDQVLFGEAPLPQQILQ
jgi:hypothetical protein